MKFCEKLDFLMIITKTTNSCLAMHISLDSSHISRLRRGERRLVPDAEYLINMASYFTRQCLEEYQKSALAEIIKTPMALFDCPDKVTAIVYKWLLFEENAAPETPNYFLEEFNSTKTNAPPLNGISTSNSIRLKAENDISLYYGIEGKREAVLRFLSIVLDNSNPGELLLYSDEPLDWLTEDIEFHSKWVHLLSRVISQGNHLKIIHTVSRNLDEMLETISIWTPLYMSGAIEPYYYPKKRDGIFKRTIFVAPGKVAISVNSLGLMTDKVTNILFQEKIAIESLKEEFNGYLNLCKPLMRIYTNKNRNEYPSTLDEFEKELENTILYNGELSLATMPDHVAITLIERTLYPVKKELMAYFDLKREGFLEVLKTKKFTEIIKIDDVLNIMNGYSKIAYTGINNLSELIYTVTEYKDHLLNVVYLLKNYDNYNIILDNTTRNQKYRLYVKEDFGAIIKKNTKPYVVFATNEANITAAFWDYLSLIIYENECDKENVIRKLETIISDLEE